MSKLTVLVTLRTDYQWRKGLNMDVLAWTPGHEKSEPEALAELRLRPENRSAKFGWNIELKPDFSVSSAKYLYFVVWECGCSWGISDVFQNYQDAEAESECRIGNSWVLSAPRV